MLLVISPAKTLDFENPPHTEQFTQGDFLARSQKLISQLQKLSPDDISALMK
ncbi:peroxide stress protein YaaA, partial [Zhongshania sp.]|uniref:peroxide stress protein YaaA n=1 Tax=Zhongshania sp. TaxID=1971902 RepID=UPI001B456821